MNESEIVNITPKNRAVVRITCGFLLLLAAVTVLCGVEFTLTMLLAAAVHELGHVACAALCGGAIRGFRLNAAGAELTIEGRFNYLQEAVIALSGPLAGGLLAAGALCAGELTHDAWAYRLCGVSALYTLFNLLPLGSMDGGRVLYSLLCHFAGPLWAERICLICDILCALAFFGFGFFVLFATGGNCTVLICAVFVIKGCCKRPQIGVKSN